MTQPQAATNQNLTEEEYDPYSHRVVEKATTNLDTFIHCLKGSVGSGVLAMPHAFIYSGTIIGVVGTIILSGLLTYAILLLVRTQLIICKLNKQPYIAYPFAMKKACKLGPKGFQILAPVAPIIVDFFLVCYQLGICCTYLAFISTTLKEILEPNVFKYHMNYRMYLLMILVPVLIINCIRNLKHLTPVSLVADVLTIIGFIIILYYILGTGPFKMSTTTYFGTILDYPLFFGVVMFSLEAVGVVLALEENMKTPQDFPRVFCYSMCLIIFIYTFIGFMGYAKYGSEVQGSITNSIPKGTALSIMLKGLFAFCIFCSYPLQCYVSLEIIWQNYLKQHIKDQNKELLAEYGMRSLVILTTFVIVLGVSRFELLISFVGAFCLSSLGLIFPFAMELCVLWPSKNYGCYKYILIKDILGMFIGVLLLIMGSYCAIITVIKYKDD